jgi:hypothetical protein
MRARWQSWAAWWSGDLDRLMRDTPATAPGGYWERRRKGGTTKIHLPLAADLARTTAELVYGDTPTITFGDAKPVQDAWDDIAQKIGWANTLLESGEVGGALGGSYLRGGWDKSVAQHPLPMVVRADQALPEFRFNQLHAVCFATELPPPADWTARNRGEVWRWLEHHEPGQIRQELWLGSAGNIGHALPLEEHPHTKHLEGVIDTRPIRDGILVEYVPNDLPQPLDALPLGRSVLQGVETLLDQLDEVWDSWMRDIRLGKGRILLSKEMLDPVAGPQQRSRLGGMFGGRKNTAAAAFDVDAEAFVGLEMTPEGKDGGPAPITQVQFAIRVQEHYDTAMALVEQITSRQGFAPQTMGMNVDGQISGTAMRRRDLRSHRTKDRIRRYARSPQERFAETLMLINAWAFGGPRPTARPTLEWPADQADPKETAETIEILRRALAMSIEIAVQMAHPEWDEPQVSDEVKRINAEQAALTAPVLDGTEPLTSNQGEPPALPGTATKEQADIFGLLWRSGATPEDAARKAGITDISFIDNPRPVTVAPAKGDAPPAPGAPADAANPKPAPFPPGR